MTRPPRPSTQLGLPLARPSEEPQAGVDHVELLGALQELLTKFLQETTEDRGEVPDETLIEADE